MTDQASDLELIELRRKVAALESARAEWQADRRRLLETEDELRRTRDDLEDRVRRRTAELASANDELKMERYLLHALMDNLPHNIYFKDTQSRFLRINRAMARLFNLADAAQARGKTDFDFFTGEHAQQAADDEREILRTGRAMQEKEEKETWPDGHATWVASIKMPLEDDAGRIVGTFGISRDVTLQKQAAEALQAAKEAAEEANRAKSTFLANMSHEIRTPLNAIIGMTELVLKSQLMSQQRDFLLTVKDAGEALLSVINDILDFSKIEAGKMSLDLSPFDLWESLGDTLKSFGLRASEQELELVYRIHPDVPRQVVGDYNRLRQIVVNLVANALKFTPQGEVLLEAAVESRSDGEVLLHFTVQDTGIGIAAEKQAMIFEMFQQADSSTTRRYGGTGLGLAIASRLVDLMGGRIWVESEAGRGSRFHFTARLGIAPAVEPPAVAPRLGPLEGCRVLVVDDNATNRLILDEVLKSWRMLPTLAAGAGEALPLLHAADEAGAPFDLVLTDTHMPDVDGFGLTAQIKEDPGVGGTVVMMLTSGDRPEDVARCRHLGVSAYLLKPIKPSELLEAIERGLGLRDPQDELAAERRGPAVQGLRVLLVEDSLVNQKLAVALLEGRGHSVAVAGNGQAALDVLAEKSFDLVLMDLQMPGMDGLEATSRIRARERGSPAHVPVVAITAHALKGDRERCLAAGMDAYISKPIRANELLGVIDDLFQNRAASPAAAVVEEPSCPAVVNWPEALKALGGDRQLLRTVVQVAAEEIPRLLETLAAAVAAGDPAGTRHTAHTLHGSIRYFGAERASQCALALEAAGREQSLGGAERLLRALRAEIAALLADLNAYLAPATAV